jgi:hypothetical protein
MISTKIKKIWGECIKTGKDYESENRILAKTANTGTLLEL